MGKCIEIEVNDDGTVTVAECAPKEEMMGGGGMEGEGAGQSFGSVDEALNAAKAMLGGQGDQGQMSPEEAFTGGFKQARGQPMGM